VTQSANIGSIEFIRLGGHAVRVTSMRRDPESGSMTMVTIVRGSRDAELLRELLERAPLELELPDEPPMPVSVDDLDIRVSGEGPAVISRFAMTFSPLVGPPPVRIRTLEQRVADLEAQVEALTAQLRNLPGDPGQE
jgi:hypothetical protein